MLQDENSGYGNSKTIEEMAELKRRLAAVLALCDGPVNYGLTSDFRERVRAAARGETYHHDGTGWEPAAARGEGDRPAEHEFCEAAEAWLREVDTAADRGAASVGVIYVLGVIAIAVGIVWGIR